MNPLHTWTLIWVFCSLLYSCVVWETDSDNLPLGCGSRISVCIELWKVLRARNWNIPHVLSLHFVLLSVSPPPVSLSLPALSSLTFCLVSDDPLMWNSWTLINHNVLGLLECSLLVSNTQCELRSLPPQSRCQSGLEPTPARQHHVRGAKEGKHGARVHWGALQLWGGQRNLRGC